jgi:hypothetical protein
MICRKVVNREWQRQNAIALAYTEIFFACGQLRNRLVARQTPIRRNEKEEKSWENICYFGSLTGQKYLWI